jgi:hypothetical protein
MFFSGLKPPIRYDLGVAVFFSETTMFIELDDGKIYRKAPYFMVKTMVSCRFSLKPIQ